MNTRTFLSIYQTYSLEKISALNKKGLAMQYAQCEQLVKLRKEMAANNKATNKILQNQIKELEGKKHKDTINRWHSISTMLLKSSSKKAMLISNPFSANYFFLH